jgi:hypothetical protein
MATTTAKDVAAVLDDFIKHARELTTLRYTQELSKPISVSIQFKGDTIETSREGPDEEDLRSFLLTLRLFCQDNEQISLRNLVKRVEKLPVSEALKKPFLDRRDQLNVYLDSAHGPPQFQIGNAGWITNREIFEAFTYGKYAHLTQSETIAGWEKLVMGDGLRAAYDRVLRRMLADIVSIAKHAEEIRKALPA